jgi:hypothetical protein
MNCYKCNCAITSVICCGRYCAPCYQKGVTFSPNWNDAGQYRCGACGQERLEPAERSAWVQLGSLSANDQRQARREYASTWERVVWSVCGPRWRVVEIHSAMQL